MNGHLRLPAAQPRQRLLRHRPNRFSRHITEDEEARGKRPAGEAGLGEALAQQHDGGVLEGVILAHGSAKGQLLHDLFDQIHVLVLISTHPGARGPLTSAMGMNGLLPLGNHCAIRDTFARAMTPREVAFGPVDRHNLSSVRGVPLGKPPAGKTVAVILVASKYPGTSVPSSSRGHRACSSLAGWPEARSPLAFAMGSVTWLYQFAYVLALAERRYARRLGAPADQQQVVPCRAERERHLREGTPYSTRTPRRRQVARPPEASRSARRRQVDQLCHAEFGA